MIQHAAGPSGEEAFDFGDFIDEVFEDTDFLFLFDEELKGIQHTSAQKPLGTTANLDFEDWFRPFRDTAHGAPCALPNYTAPSLPSTTGMVRNKMRTSVRKEAAPT